MRELSITCRSKGATMLSRFMLKSFAVVVVWQLTNRLMH